MFNAPPTPEELIVLFAPVTVTVPPPLAPNPPPAAVVIASPPPVKSTVALFRAMVMPLLPPMLLRVLVAPLNVIVPLLLWRKMPELELLRFPERVMFPVVWFWMSTSRETVLVIVPE